MNIKQVIVMRTKFPDGKGGFMSMRKGKIASQAAHASMKVFFDRGRFVETISFVNSPSGAYGRRLEINMDDCMVEWYSGTFTKICLQIESEDELKDIYAKAKEQGLPCNKTLDIIRQSAIL